MQAALLSDSRELIPAFISRLGSAPGKGEDALESFTFILTAALQGFATTTTNSWQSAIPDVTTTGPNRHR